MDAALLGQQMRNAFAAASPSGGWQPIATAPKDGSEILVYCGPDFDPMWGVAHWHEPWPNAARYHKPEDCHPGWMMWWQEDFRHHTWPEFWMALPEPPAQGTEAGTAETGTGSVHEGPVVEDDAPQLDPVGEAKALLEKLSDAAPPGPWAVEDGVITETPSRIGSAIATGCGYPDRWPATRAFIVALVNDYRKRQQEGRL
jgi:hypothetical protein